MKALEAIYVGNEVYLRHLCCYIHANPVHHGIAAAPELWPYSTTWSGSANGRATCWIALHRNPLS
ncbi:MAG: hypothetical protein R3E79_60295 [Caldilineaceae bacterium]